MGFDDNRTFVQFSSEGFEKLPKVLFVIDERPGPYYWRIGYRERTETGPPTHWSATRSFTIGPAATVWERSATANPDFASKGHPRVLFNKQTLPKLRELVKQDEESRIVFDGIKRRADRTVRSELWGRIPEDDHEPAMTPYVSIANDLVVVAFCWRVTGDDKYAGVKERALQPSRHMKTRPMPRNVFVSV